MNTKEYYSDINRKELESVEMKRMNLGPVVQKEADHKKKNKYHILTHTYEM